MPPWMTLPPAMNPAMQQGSYDEMAGPMGVLMPDLPQRDQLGMYGLTDEQRNSAGNQALSNTLMGAAQSIFTSDPSAVLRAGGMAGGIQRQALGDYSKGNVGDYALRVKAAMDKLDAMGKMSDIDLQRQNIKLNEDKLRQMEEKNLIAKKWGEEMTPVGQQVLAEFAQKHPEDTATLARLRGGLVATQALLSAGDIDGADKLLNSTMEMSPEWVQKSMASKMASQTMIAAQKYGVQLETAQELMKQFGGSPAFKGYKFGIGATGNIEFLSPEDQLKVADAHRLVGAQVDLAGAQAERLKAQAAAAGMMKPEAISRETTAVMQAIEVLKEPTYVELSKKADWQKRAAAAKGILAKYNIDPDPNSPTTKGLTSSGVRGLVIDFAQQNLLMQSEYGPAAIAQGLGGGGGGRRPAGATGTDQILGFLEKGLAGSPSPGDLDKMVSIFRRAPNPEIQSIFEDVMLDNPAVYRGDKLQFLKLLKDRISRQMGRVNPDMGTIPVPDITGSPLGSYANGTPQID